MTIDKWDLRFLKLAEEIASWSKDPSTKVGAVLVERDTHLVLGLGYNGFPRGVSDFDDRYEDRDFKYKFVVHAEVNAILMAGKLARGAVLYVYPSFMLPPVCHECCKVVIQAGVAEIVGYVVPEEDLNDRQRRWQASIAVSRTMCDEAGVTYRGVPAP